MLFKFGISLTARSPCTFCLYSLNWRHSAFTSTWYLSRWWFLTLFIWINRCLSLSCSLRRSRVKIWVEPLSHRLCNALSQLVSTRCLLSWVSLVLFNDRSLTFKIGLISWLRFNRIFNKLHTPLNIFCNCLLVLCTLNLFGLRSGFFLFGLSLLCRITLTLSLRFCIFIINEHFLDFSEKSSVSFLFLFKLNFRLILWLVSTFRGFSLSTSKLISEFTLRSIFFLLGLFQLVQKLLFLFFKLFHSFFILRLFLMKLLNIVCVNLLNFTDVLQLFLSAFLCNIIFFNFWRNSFFLVFFCYW